MDADDDRPSSDLPDDELDELVGIPYDPRACDLFMACLRYIVDTCAQQGALMGVEYEIAYREMIAKVITTPLAATPDDASATAPFADQQDLADAIRRATRQTATPQASAPTSPGDQ